MDLCKNEELANKLSTFYPHIEDVELFEQIWEEEVVKRDVVRSIYFGRTSVYHNLEFFNIYDFNFI